MTLNWTEKYRPKHLNEIKGNQKAIKDLKRWANSWKNGRPKRQPACILAGDAGTGKTSAAIALANDMGWAIIELNASDARNYENINRIVTKGVTHETFSDTGEFRRADSGGRKLVILDEADNLYERRGGRKKMGSGASSDMSDRGGKKAIIEAISKARQPIILIVNDAYALTKGRGASIKRNAKMIRFDPVEKDSIKDALKKIAMKENLIVDAKVIKILADKAGGDLRSAINDLQTLSVGKKKIGLKDMDVLGYRDPRPKIFGALRTIFKTKSLTMAKDAIKNIDEDPQSLLLWIDENLPLEYKQTQDMIDAYHFLCKSDIFLRRVYRRQYFGLWSYANELMAGGVALAKRKINDAHVRYNFPMYLIKMARTKGERGLQDRVMRKFRKQFHCSTTGARDMLLVMRGLMKKDRKMATKVIDKMKLDESELSNILGNSDLAARLIEEMEEMDQLDDEVEGTTSHLDEFGEAPQDDDGGDTETDGTDDGKMDDTEEGQQKSLKDFF